MGDRPDLDAIRARWEATTPGEWSVDEGGGVSVYDVDYEDPRFPTGRTIFFEEGCYGPNFEFAAHAHQDIPALLAYIDDLERRLAGSPSL